MGELERTRGGGAPPGPPGTPLACASGAGRYAQGASGAAEQSQPFLSSPSWRRAPLALRSGKQRTAHLVISPGSHFVGTGSHLGIQLPFCGIHTEKRGELEL